MKRIPPTRQGSGVFGVFGTAKAYIAYAEHGCPRQQKLIAALAREGGAVEKLYQTRRTARRQGEGVVAYVEPLFAAQHSIAPLIGQLTYVN